jgi:HNH endonuclease
VKNARADLAAELARSTTNWTQHRPMRQFEDSAAGRARYDDTTEVMREHGYEPGPMVPNGQGRIDVAYLNEEARAREDAERAYRSLYGPSSELIGLPQPSDAFECVECGRWAAVLPSAEVYARLVVTELGFNLPEWSGVRLAAESNPLRPAFFQREFGKDYEEAIAILDAAVRLGMLAVSKKGIVAAQPRCDRCYERRAAVPEPGPPASTSRDLIPPQLRFRVLQRDGFRCQYCGRSARDGATLHLDHVVPVAAGGQTSEDNLITACETCNLGKSAGDVV